MTYQSIAAILILITAMILTLPAKARQEVVAPTLRSACADLKVSATSPAFGVGPALLPLKARCRAAELCQMPVERFMEFAAQHDVPLHYGADELDEDRTP